MVIFVAVLRMLPNAVAAAEMQQGVGAELKSRGVAESPSKRDIYSAISSGFWLGDGYSILWVVNLIGNRECAN